MLESKPLTFGPIPLNWGTTDHGIQHEGIGPPSQRPLQVEHPLPTNRPTQFDLLAGAYLSPLMAMKSCINCRHLSLHRENEEVAHEWELTCAMHHFRPAWNYDRADNLFEIVFSHGANCPDFTPDGTDGRQ